MGEKITHPIPFYKYQANGNHFLIIEKEFCPLMGSKKWSPWVKKVCHPNFGVGGDGVLVLSRPEKSKNQSKNKADFFLKIWNSDGSESLMCGNGIRAASLFLFHQTGMAQLNIETGSGIYQTHASENQTQTTLGKGVLKGEKIIGSIPKKWSHLLDRDSFFSVDMGNPHLVIITLIQPKELPLEDIFKWVTGILGHEVNVSLVFPGETPGFYYSRVRERGVGETFACGSGSCAVFLSLEASKKLKKITLSLPGGQLEVSRGKNGELVLKGRTKKVFQGHIYF